MAFFNGPGALEIGGITPPGGHARNGGDHSRRGGGDIAKRVSKFGLQFRLIGFDEQKVVAASLFDRLNDGTVSEGCIACDHGALKRQAFDQLKGLHRLAAVRRHRQRAYSGFKLGGKGMQHVHAGACLALAAAQALAVDSDMAKPIFALNEAAQGLYELRSRKRFENIMIRDSQVLAMLKL